MSNVLKITIPPGIDFFINESDLPLFNAYKWRAYKHWNTFYAKAWVKLPDGTKKKLYFHRVLLNISDRSVLVDHKNGNGLDNSRDNLRLCNNAQNSKNQRVTPKSYTKYKGVFRNKSYCKKPFVSSIQYNGKWVHLGTFMDDKDAAIAYNNAALMYHGEFARLNKID